LCLEKEDDLIQPKSEALVDVVSRANDLFEKGLGCCICTFLF